MRKLNKTERKQFESFKVRQLRIIRMMKLVDLFVGFVWILISISQTFLLGWQSYGTWIATGVIWLLILRLRISYSIREALMDLI